MEIFHKSQFKVNASGGWDRPVPAPIQELLEKKYSGKRNFSSYGIKAQFLKI
jgi:hypothetical protein